MIDRGIGQAADTHKCWKYSRALSKRKKTKTKNVIADNGLEWCDQPLCAPIRDSSGDRKSECVLVATAATMLIAVDSAVRWAVWEDDRAQANSLSFSFLFGCFMLTRNRGETVRWVTMA
jgi:hypothetical protein